MSGLVKNQPKTLRITSAKKELRNMNITKNTEHMSGIELERFNKQYQGRRDNFKKIVTVDGHPLDLRLDVINKSPTGFEWGYGGSGPRQLSAAILVDYLDDKEEARKLCADFERIIVKKLPNQRWTLLAEDIEGALIEIRGHGTFNE